MLICFHVNTEAKNALDGILGRGEFRDISEAISAALVNYNVLTQMVAEGGQIFAAGAPLQPCGPDAAERAASAHAPLRAHVGRTAQVAPQIPDAFKLGVTEPDAINLFESPRRPATDTNDLAPARWLFGQFNKFLAPKATCRALLNLLLENPAGMPVAEAINKVSYAACLLGDYLRWLDQRIESKREDAFASAFPTSATADGGGESRLRFGNQFVAHIRQNQLGGFPAALRLIALETVKGPRLSLTKAGAQFARLENPVLDGPDDLPARKLSEPETEFLLAHITQFVPEETSAYAAILDAIEAGSNTPDGVDKFLRQRFNLPTEKAITKTFLTTQRTGAISRMADLGLLGRRKEGLRVTYLVTKAGAEFCAELNS